MTTLLYVTTTLERKDDAERLGNALLEKRLIACAQISSPITSIYRWRGKTTTATEFVLGVKTISQCFPQIEKFLLQEHPYEVPEIIAQEIPLASKAYKDWVILEVEHE